MKRDLKKNFQIRLQIKLKVRLDFMLSPVIFRNKKKFEIIRNEIKINNLFRKFKFSFRKYKFVP